MPHPMKIALDQFRASTAHLTQRLMAKKSEASEKVAELYLYDVIGQDWFGGVTAKDVADALASVKDATSLNVYLNSPGGDVFEGMTIYNQIRRFEGPKNIYVDGLAASIASVIALAGDKVYTAPNAMWMIHNPWTYAVGNADDLRKKADNIEKIGKTLLETYAKKTGQPVAKLQAWMDAETWMNATESKDNGFTDEILADDDAEDSVCVCGKMCGEDCSCKGKCDAEGKCCTCPRDDAEEDKTSSRVTANPILARYRNTPRAIRDRVTSRTLVSDVTKRLARASPSKK